MRGTGELSGEVVFFLGPSRDERPQGSVGGEDAVVTVAVDAGWREDLGESVQELESRETEGGAAGEVGPWEQVEDLVGAAADQVEAVEGKRRPGTVANEALQSGPVGGLDADARIQTEPAAVIPGEHITGGAEGEGHGSSRCPAKVMVKRRRVMDGFSALAMMEAPSRSTAWCGGWPWILASLLGALPQSMRAGASSFNPRITPP
jgi:hypothetical protein